VAGDSKSKRRPKPKGGAQKPESASPRADASLQAFRDALEKSVTISRERLQEIVDDAVRRGRMTRADSEELVGRVLSRGREQAEELLGQIEPLISDSAIGRARRDVESKVRGTARKARNRADEPLAGADRLRRRARLPGFPITAYDQLTVPQINRRLADLSTDELRKVLDYETGNRKRVGVVRAIERKLDSAAG
jgi:polyhydroxyalkanoate synthesis regulator phasin